MARNEEKAKSALNRWRKLQEEDSGKISSKKRPYLASLCTNLREAEKWRSEIVNEIGQYVLSIQNPSLGEYKLRDMNDHINKLIREKSYWDKQIVSLGGKSSHNPVVDDTYGSKHYRYFGAARNLPGIKELFEKPQKTQWKQSKAILFRNINCDYFGFRDEDDGTLLDIERNAEEKLKRVSA